MRGLKDKTFLTAGGATAIGATTAKRLASESACGGRVDHRSGLVHRQRLALTPMLITSCAQEQNCTPGAEKD
jgi:NAD(P)-dependent dehydrogenase (short-subunit alcohol dehydrogenase family)